jgi:hypothetical protein
MEPRYRSVHVNGILGQLNVPQLRDPIAFAHAVRKRNEHSYRVYPQIFTNGMVSEGFLSSFRERESTYERVEELHLVNYTSEEYADEKLIFSDQWHTTLSDFETYVKEKLSSME